MLYTKMLDKYLHIEQNGSQDPFFPYGTYGGCVAKEVSIWYNNENLFEKDREHGTRIDV